MLGCVCIVSLGTTLCDTSLHARSEKRLMWFILGHSMVISITSLPECSDTRRARTNGTLTFNGSLSTHELKIAISLY